MTDSAGTLLRDWRQRRNVSQLDLAHRAGVSARHVSFIETGRSQPTSTMLLRLADNLDVPLREQNRLLLAGGYAPAHPEHKLADPPMAQVSAAITAILAAHLPFPALVIDKGWDLVDANDAIYSMLDGVAAELVEPPINVIRLSLHENGLAPRIANLPEWRNHLIHRLRSEYAVSGDARIAELIEEFSPSGLDDARWRSLLDHPGKLDKPAPSLVVPLRLHAGATTLAFLSTTTVFGTPREVTLSELAIEAFYPADQATRDLLMQ